MKIKLFNIAMVSVLIIAAPTLAIAQSATCTRLESQLRALNSSNISATQSNRSQNYEAAIQRQEVELQRTESYANSLGCNEKILIFETGPAACNGLKSQIRQMKSTLNQLYSQMERVERGGGSVSGQRQQIIEALQNYNCPGYAAPQQLQQQQRIAQPQQQVGPRQPGQSFFGWLFGGEEEAPNQSYYNPNTGFNPDGSPILDPDKPFIGSGYRTVCVRHCDGFFFPINFLTSSASFESDERTCKAQCPGAESSLFAYHNPGQDISDAVDINGRGYMSLPNALKFREGFNPSCSCKSGFNNWRDALQDAQQKLGNKSGDVLVSEKRAAELSMPKELIKQTSINVKDGNVLPTPTPGEVKKETTLSDGSKKIIRQVGPKFFADQ